MPVSRKAIRLGLMIQSRVREIIRQLEPSLYQHLHAWRLIQEGIWRSPVVSHLVSGKPRGQSPVVLVE